MDNNDVQLVGGPCGQHGPYTFYKAFKYTKNGVKRIVTLSEFFFIKMWRDSDLLCIGELQLLWIDKNSEQMLASLRLYFLPENTPEGRMDHGEDEVLAISEKVVIRIEDLITWITMEAQWTWGWLAKCESELKICDLEPSKCAPPKKSTGTSFTLSENALDFSDVENERKNADICKDSAGHHVIILSFPKYCRYRAMMKRLEGVEDVYLKYKIVNALGGFYVAHPNTRVLFCKETFDYPELEGHELLCNHLAPKLKGRPRGKRKKRSLSPCSESNESESSLTNSYNTRADNKNSLPGISGIAPRRSTRCHENNENKEFVKTLNAFMRSNHTPIGRIPSLGYKELNLHEFYTKIQKLGGYDAVTTNRLWKSIFDDMSGNQNSTSAATVIRRHYERFLLPYERHVKGEEYKPLPATERRRLKMKRVSSCISDAESSSGDTTPTPSTSRKSATSSKQTDNKVNNSIEGKPSSLRSVRVKPERQKDKQVNYEKDGVHKNNKNVNNNTEQQPCAKIKTENVSSELKPKIEKIIIKTESMTVKTECSNKNSSVKIEYAIEDEPVKTENIPDTIENIDTDVSDKAEIIPVESAPFVNEIKSDNEDNLVSTENISVINVNATVETECVSPRIEKCPISIENKPVNAENTSVIFKKISGPTNSENMPAKTESIIVSDGDINIPEKIDSSMVKIENNPVKVEDSVSASLKVESAPIKSENVCTENGVKMESEAKMETLPKSEDINMSEPIISALTTVVQKVAPDNIMSPLEGKENIPIFKTANNSFEITEVPCKPKVSECNDSDSDSYKNTFLYDVKKRKLDILKEGGLEVTPVRSSTLKDGRPSVIHQTSPIQIISKPVRTEEMPPPLSSFTPKRMHIAITPVPNISKAKVTPTTPVKTSPSSSTSFAFTNGLTPPKVVQSRSIYTYSEKTIYGNPKDILSPCIKPTIHAPKFVGTHRQSGGDPVDLSVNSPQRPVVEVMRVPQTCSLNSPYNRDTVTKNLYKTASTPIVDGRRLGPNLEITLVGPNNKSYSSGQKNYNYSQSQTHSSSSSQSYQQQKRPPSTEYYKASKLAKGDENGRYNKPSIPQQRHTDINIPNSYKQPTAVNTTPMKAPSQNQPGMKHFPPATLPTFPPYLSQLYEQTNKALPPFLPLLDPAMYYSAAMQSLYSSNPLNSGPLLPMPTPEQLKFYTDLMQHGRINFPFQLPQEGSSSVVNNNHLKKS